MLMEDSDQLWEEVALGIIMGFLPFNVFHDT